MRNHSRRSALAVACCVAAIWGLQSVRAAADVTLPHILGDHMVLQREIPVPVWGWAAPGEEVTVSIAGQEAKASADADGKWKLTLKPLTPPGPYTLTVTGKNKIELTDVLVGEVWLCSGQSNMDMGINAIHDAEAVVAAADHPNIRLFESPYRTSGTPKDDLDASWRVCTPASIKAGGFFGSGFSAAGYFFGRRLQEELDVPVGLIKAAWGGTRIEPWTPREGFEAMPQFADIVKKIDKSGPTYEKDLDKAIPEYEAWLPKAKKAVEEKTELPAPPKWPKHPLDEANQPTGLYNGLVNPLVPFAIRGAIWYQGESNRGDGLLYTERMKALIQGWRKKWGEGDFPFYYVQIAPFRYGDKPESTMAIWEAQSFAMSIPNTGMVVTTDLVDDIKDIHPKNKKDVGERLAQWALANTYGKKDIVYSGPIYESMSVEDGKIRIKFKYAEGGLKSRDGKPLDWFQIAGADKKFIEAKADIDKDNTILVWSDDVESPVAVRFGWDQEAMPNLVNEAGLPASPFRTDDWE